MSAAVAACGALAWLVSGSGAVLAARRLRSEATGANYNQHNSNPGVTARSLNNRIASYGGK
jgi:hypothetical protein